MVKCIGHWLAARLAFRTEAMSPKRRFSCRTRSTPQTSTRTSTRSWASSRPRRSGTWGACGTSCSWPTRPWASPRWRRWSGADTVQSPLGTVRYHPVFGVQLPTLVCNNFYLNCYFYFLSVFIIFFVIVYFIFISYRFYILCIYIFFFYLIFLMCGWHLNLVVPRAMAKRFRLWCF